MKTKTQSPASPASYGAFKEDRYRLQAVRSQHQLTQSIARVNAVTKVLLRVVAGLVTLAGAPAFWSALQQLWGTGG